MSDTASVNRITRYGSVKRRLVFDDTPSKIKATGSETPVRRKAAASSFVETPKTSRKPQPATTKFVELESGCITPVKSTAAKSMLTPKTIEQFHTPVHETGKFARLITPVKKAGSYPLPAKYQQLYDTFEFMERIVSLSKINSKRIVYEDLERDVKRKTHRSFSTAMLSQIVGVYPNSYNLKMELHRTFGMKTPGKTYDLVIEPNLKNDLEPYFRPESPVKQPAPPQSFGTPIKLTAIHNSPKKRSDFVPLSPRKTPTKTAPQLRQLRSVCGERLEAWRLACRRAIFRYKLLQTVLDVHHEFLEKKGANFVDIEFGSFHKEFDLESVPDPVAAELPQPPKIAIQKSIKDYAVSENRVIIPEEVADTIDRLRSPEKPSHSLNGKVHLSPTKFKGDTPKLSLYERIMLKQKARDEMNDVVRLEKQKKKNQLQILFDELLYSVWSAFSRIKPKTAYRFLELKHRIGNDCKSLSGDEIVEHLEVLCEVAPKNFDIYSAGIHGHKFLKRTIDSEDDYQVVKDAILKELEKIKV